MMTLLDQFEMAWQQGLTPDWREYARRPELAEDQGALVELIQIDLERRWRFGAASMFGFTAAHYLREPGLPLDGRQTVDLIVWEYHVRNRWGDCPTRHDIVTAYGDLPELDTALNAAAGRLPWPQMVVEQNHDVCLRAPFDRVISLGRREPGEPEPFCVLDSAGERRIVVASSTDSSVSRNQLKVRLTSPESVAVTNASAARSLLIAGCDVLAGGATFVLALPVCVQITASLHVRIERSHGMHQRAER